MFNRFFAVTSNPGFQKFKCLLKISSTRKEKRNAYGASKTFQFYRNQNKDKKSIVMRGKKLDLALRLNMEKMFISAALENATKSGRLVSLAELSETDMMLANAVERNRNIHGCCIEIINPLISL